MDRHAVFRSTQTIVALCSGHGGALALLRVSGSDAFAITQKLLRKDVSALSMPALFVQNLYDEGEWIDQVIVSVFRAPHSYTGQDVVELTCHASAYIIGRILDAYTKQGARLAERGEFTRRAFLNGKIDLIQAEAVQDLISSETKLQQQQAMQKMRGGFSKILLTLREELIQTVGLGEAALDFPDEQETQHIPLLTIVERVRSVCDKVGQLCQSFRSGNVLQNGVLVVIAGAPNAGKSTLFNALLQDDRAIVSHLPGTTRDTIEEKINYQGLVLRLTDTAGLRNTQEQIERLGIERSHEKIRSADIVLFLFDSQSTSVEQLVDMQALLRADCRQYLLIANKTEHVSPTNVQQKYAPLNEPIFSISALYKRGIDNLLSAIYERFIQGTQTDQICVTNARQVEVLTRMHEKLQEALDDLAGEVPQEFVQVTLKECLGLIGELTGAVQNEDILSEIFARFCIGK